MCWKKMRWVLKKEFKGVVKVWNNLGEKLEGLLTRVVGISSFEQHSGHSRGGRPPHIDASSLWHFGNDTYLNFSSFHPFSSHRFTNRCKPWGVVLIVVTARQQSLHLVKTLPRQQHVTSLILMSLRRSLSCLFPREAGKQEQLLTKGQIARIPPSARQLRIQEIRSPPVVRGITLLKLLKRKRIRLQHSQRNCWGRKVLKVTWIKALNVNLCSIPHTISLNHWLLLKLKAVRRALKRKLGFPLRWTELIQLCKELKWRSVVCLIKEQGVAW